MYTGLPATIASLCPLFDVGVELRWGRLLSELLDSSWHFVCDPASFYESRIKKHFRLKVPQMEDFLKYEAGFDGQVGHPHFPVYQAA